MIFRSLILSTLALMGTTLSVFAFSNAENTIMSIGSCSGCHASVAEPQFDEIEFIEANDLILEGAKVYTFRVNLPDNSLSGRNGYRISVFDPSTGSAVGAMVRDEDGGEFEAGDLSSTLQVADGAQSITDNEELDFQEFFWKSPASGALPSEVLIEIQLIDSNEANGSNNDLYAFSSVSLSQVFEDGESPQEKEEQISSVAQSSFSGKSSCAFISSRAESFNFVFLVAVLFFVFLFYSNRQKYTL